MYKLSYNASNPALSTSDGRPWNAYFNSKRGGFSGIRRRASCKDRQDVRMKCAGLNDSMEKKTELTLRKEMGLNFATVATQRLKTNHVLL